MIDEVCIIDPFQKLLVAKYEAELPWQKQIKDAETLCAHVRDVMLPALLNCSKNISNKEGRSFFVSKHHVNLMLALNGHQGISERERLAVLEIHDRDGKEKANEALVEIINLNKEKAFNIWIRKLEEKYPGNVVFHFLFLRPLFSLSGHGSRRALFEPVDEVIDWLFKRIARERVSPNENLAKLYCLKLASNYGSQSYDGWRYVPAGIENAARLSALCRGSGWCVAASAYASSYLEESDFYILWANKKPVVALRQKIGQKIIVECQGRNNASPDGWFHDIQLFVESREMLLEHRDNELEGEVGNDWSDKSFAWWQDRCRLWPFGLFFAPAGMRQDLLEEFRPVLAYYYNFPDYQNLLKLLDQRQDLSLNISQWCELIKLNPIMYGSCPECFRPDIQCSQACLYGWRERAEDDELSLLDFEHIPTEIKEHPDFLISLSHSFPVQVRDAIRKKMNTRADRESPFDIQSVLPECENEPQMIVVERMINTLLSNMDGVFTDEQFSLIIRNRQDFYELRRHAWQSAIGEDPTLWFALPQDLQNEDSFLLTDKIKRKVDLESWVIKVLEKPWLLTQKKGVPESLRNHTAIIDAYYNGWKKHVMPWQFWVQKGGYGYGYTHRVHMSYALLANERFLHVMTEQWIKYGVRMWDRASQRMRRIPAVQLTFLRACSKLDKKRAISWDFKLAIGNEISQQKTKLSSLFDEEIEDLIDELIG